MTTPLPGSLDVDAPSLAGFLPYHSVDPEGPLVLLADNARAIPDSLGLIWRLAPPETEAVSDSQLGALAARLDTLLGNLPEGTAGQVLLRSSKNTRARFDAWTRTTKSQDPLLADLAHSRRSALEKLSVTTGGALFETRDRAVYLTLIRPGTWPQSDVSPLSALAAVASGGSSGVEDRFAAAYASDRKEFLDLAKTLETLMAQAGLRFLRLGLEEVARELYTALNPSRARTLSVPAALPGELLRERVAGSSLGVDLDEGILSLDDFQMKMVSVTHLPKKTYAGMLVASVSSATVADTVPELDLILNFTILNQEEIRLKFGGQRQLATDQSRDAHVSPLMGPLAGELSEIERELGAGARVLSMRLHAIVRARTREGAADAARAVHASLQTAGFRAVVEDALAYPLFPQTLPLGYRPDPEGPHRRARQALTLNLAHLLPVYGSCHGTPAGAQILLNRRGEPITLGFFNAKEVPHAIVSGKSGAGKSVFANDLILHARRTDARVFVADRGGSYKRLIEMLEGVYVSYDAKRPMRLNPCGTSGADGSCSEETNSFLRDWLTEMATRGKSDLSVRDQGLLSMAVRQAFHAKPGKEIFVSDIHAALGALAHEHPAAKDLAICLSEFVSTGPYARFFDGPNEIDFTNPLVAFDLAEAALEEAVSSVLVMALMHGIATAAKTWLAQDKYFVIDEAWTLLKSPASARFIENVARTARKNRLSLVVVSQQVTDLEGKTGQAILAQTTYKVFLYQDADAVRHAAELVGLSPRETELYQSLRTAWGLWSELFIKTPFSTGVARLVLDPLTYWITTSDPKDHALLDGWIAKAHARGLAGREALRHGLMEAALGHPHGAQTLPAAGRRDAEGKPDVTER